MLFDFEQQLDDNMKNVMREYASSVIGLISAILFFLVTGTLLFGTDGILAEMITIMGGSGLR